MNTAFADAIRQIVAAGQESGERMAKLVGDLTAQVEASSGSAVARTQDGLNLISDQLIGKVERFSEEIAQATGRNAQATHASVQKILDETSQLYRQNSEQTAAVLDRYQRQLERTETLGGELTRLAEQFRAALPEYSTLTKGLQTIAAETSMAVQRSKDAAGSMQEAALSLRAVQNQVTEVAKYSEKQVTELATTARQTQESMTDYTRIFATVKTQAGELLAVRHYQFALLCERDPCTVSSRSRIRTTCI